MLCRACSEITFPSVITGHPNKRFHSLHQSHDALADALALGCDLCLLIAGKLDHTESHSDICYLLDAYVVLICSCREPWLGNNPCVEKLSSISVATRRGNIVLQIIEPIPDKYAFLYADPPRLGPKLRSHTSAKAEPQRKRQRRLAQYSQPTSSEDESPQGHDMSTGSTKNFELAQIWLDQCHDHHSHCKVNQSSATSNPLPTRLINVEQAERPFLEETNARTKGQYVALSYAWGEGKRVLTEKKNYKAHQKCLPLRGLPKTFADAIKVTQALKYKYIWIDAFCIIQYDEKDLGRELPKMGDIYRYADFTIYSEGAESSHTGIFVTRDSRLYRPCKVPLAITTSKGISKGEVTVATTWNGQDYLKSRGWVLQERVLSSRCLIFGQQMAWACTMGHAQETRPVMQLKQPLPQSSTTWVPERMRLSLYAATTVPSGLGDVQRSRSHFDIWYTMLEEYGDKELSFEKDNIPALSGLAALFHKAHNTTYLGGLWKEDLHRGLAWYVGLNDERPVCDKETGPSWSWASVGKVRIKFRSWRRTLGLLQGTGADVLGVTYDVSGLINPYGLVEDGSINLSAPLRQAVLEYTSDYAESRLEKCYGGSSPLFDGIDARESPRYPALLLQYDTRQPVAEVALDRPFHSTPGAGTLAAASVSRVEVWCLLLHVQEARGGSHGTLLVLERDKKDSKAFKRLGLGFLEEKYWPWFGLQSESVNAKPLMKEKVKIT
ncbi:heterokaryon incompatibility protein-domain-containing protein [Dactylonectria macrodidyma]|uniref:Heterokaryon incompatibility protein-domain-containing protein n=1 Tax=Dactylonectria macrodidyma TaxID=307937 RepID=A0A9P9DVD6_9HYPO|nr:heterokaryon incompatibility protein-domain-containing protein [Dactylonectria macrodidyma]